MTTRSSRPPRLSTSRFIRSCVSGRGSGTPCISAAIACASKGPIQIGSSRPPLHFSTSCTTGEPVVGSSRTSRTSTSTGAAAAHARPVATETSSAERPSISLHSTGAACGGNTVFKSAGPRAEIPTGEPMRTDPKRQPRHALVLAGGGIVGGLYEVGALLALDALCDGFTVCDFDLYVGSSAGAFVASLLVNRVSAERLRDTVENDRRTLPRLAGSRFLSLPWRGYLLTIPRLAAAVPLLFEPVRIDGIDYVDAAITKTAHAGLAVEAGARLVVVINPVRPLVLDAPTRGHIRDGGPLAVAGQALRIALQRRLHDGL